MEARSVFHETPENRGTYETRSSVDRLKSDRPPSIQNGTGGLPIRRATSDQSAAAWGHTDYCPSRMPSTPSDPNDNGQIRSSSCLGVSDDSPIETSIALKGPGDGGPTPSRYILRPDGPHRSSCPGDPRGNPQGFPEGSDCGLPLMGGQKVSRLPRDPRKATTRGRRSASNPRETAVRVRGRRSSAGRAAHS